MIAAVGVALTVWVSHATTREQPLDQSCVLSPTNPKTVWGFSYLWLWCHGDPTVHKLCSPLCAHPHTLGVSVVLDLRNMGTHELLLVCYSQRNPMCIYLYSHKPHVHLYSHKHPHMLTTKHPLLHSHPGKCLLTFPTPLLPTSPPSLPSSQVFGEQVGIPPVVGAILAVGMLLGTGVLNWREDCLKGTPQAWDTLFWFGGEGVMGRAADVFVGVGVGSGWGGLATCIVVERAT